MLKLFNERVPDGQQWLLK